MQNLMFNWIASFNDNTSLSQFDNEGNEVLFKEVQNRFSDLTLFTISHQRKNLSISVDLIQGLIFVNDQQRPWNNEIEKNNIRLIFFRRHRVVIDDIGRMRGQETVYFLGFQYQDQNGNNCQEVLQIDQQGNILVD